MISGSPRIADVPGGVGTRFGSANTKINAPNARSPAIASRSPVETRSRLSSSATWDRSSDSAEWRLPVRSEAADSMGTCELRGNLEPVVYWMMRAHECDSCNVRADTSNWGR